MGQLADDVIKAHIPVSIRHVARATGLSKSRVHRLGQSMARRNQHPESAFWETVEGHQWLIRLVVAALYHFGLRRGSDNGFGPMTTSPLLMMEGDYLPNSPALELSAG